MAKKLTGKIQVELGGTIRIEFFAPGLPKPGGSKKGFYVEKLKRVVITDASNNKDWRNAVRTFCYQSLPEGFTLLSGPLTLRIQFRMPRPKSHYRTGAHAGELRPDAPHFHTHAPDSTKLTRSTEDALTGMVWHDDALVARQSIEKVYADSPGAYVVIETLADVHATPVPMQTPLFEEALPL